uniref:Microtubule binding protein n=1 Tax=Encephalitozoon cuniculi TaxID=6035 RepID=M1KA34_ENCCN|nr:microtubule binding protein [Encephalitozoon cuniculi]
MVGGCWGVECDKALVHFTEDIFFLENVVVRLDLQPVVWKRIEDIEERFFMQVIHLHVLYVDLEDSLVRRPWIAVWKHPGKKGRRIVCGWILVLLFSDYGEDFAQLVLVDVVDCLLLLLDLLQPLLDVCHWVRNLGHISIGRNKALLGMTQKSRRELIEWIRSLGIGISAIEELGKGVAICKILSIIHKDFPQNFVKNPAGEHDYLRNMKICQEFFGSRNIKLYFPVDRLVKCKMQDNLEVAQWLARYYSKNASERPCGESLKREGPRASILPGTSLQCPECKNTREIMDAKDNRIKELEGMVASMEDRIMQMEADKSRAVDKVPGVKSSAGGFDDDEVKSLLMAFEKERDFYFRKLFTIEKYFLEREGLDEGLRSDVFGILYEENGE